MMLMVIFHRPWDGIANQPGRATDPRKWLRGGSRFLMSRYIFLGGGGGRRPATAPLRFVYLPQFLFQPGEKRAFEFGRVAWRGASYAGELPMNIFSGCAEIE